MKTIKSISEMQQLAATLKREGKSLGFVPTMGFFHEGHISLMKAARRDSQIVITSIFVNPTQFGPQEDLAAYPRDLERDSRLAQKAGVDILFIPEAGQMYPDHYQTSIVVKDLSQNLCGRFRPGHFEGVATVVAKLFLIVKPDMAYFGQKDFQQLAIIKRMSLDLNLEIKIKGLPIVREKDGLAMSSRNSYLSEEQRRAALCLYRSICRAQQMRKNGISQTSKIIVEIKQVMAQEPLVRPQYIQICHPETLEDIEYIEEQALLAMSIYIGKTRLIDNCLL